MSVRKRVTLQYTIDVHEVLEEDFGWKGLDVLICGGRDFTDESTFNFIIRKIQDELRFTTDLVISGGANGADTLAIKYAKSNFIPYKVFMADWNAFGKSAGPIRNQQMLTEGNPDLVIAMAGGRGTADMVNRARKAGVPVCIFNGGGTTQ